MTADPSLAEKELGFNAPQDLETMCRDLWNWQIKHPHGYEDVVPVKSLDSSEVKTDVNGHGGVATVDRNGV